MLDALGGSGDGGAEPNLHRLVVQLSRAAAVLTATDGEIESVVDDLATVASTLADRAPELERAMATMPATLREARTGLVALDGTLARLQATAPGARPSVVRLTELLRKLPPVLRKATPLLADLRPVLADLKPALDDLAPTAGLLRQLLGDLEDPVLGRLSGHVVPALLGPYTATGRSTKVYEELGQFVAGLDGVSSFVNDEGSQLNFYIGLNAGCRARRRRRTRRRPTSLRAHAQERRVKRLRRKLRYAWTRIRATKGLGRDLAIIAGLVVLASAVGGYILSHQRVSFPWQEKVSYRADFEEAPGVAPGQGQEVRIAGVPVGEITKADITGDGRARLTLSL